MNYKAIFEALPHVNTIWIVGENFHLHSDYGGEKIERNALKTETVNLIEKKGRIDDKVKAIEPIVDPIPVIETIVEEQTKEETT